MDYKCYHSGEVSYFNTETANAHLYFKANIVFDSSFDSERLEEVLQQTGLAYDIAFFEAAVDTLVGEKGATLR